MDEIPDRLTDDGEWSAAAAGARAEPSAIESDDDYLLNDIGIALRLLREWH